MAVTGTITTRFIDENGVDLGKQLIEKDYLISLYPNLFPQYKTSGLYLWGGNSSGQLGDNTVTNKSSPVQTVTYGYTWKQVAAGSSHTVGLKNDGTLWTWGSNAYGQLGDGTFSAKSSPVQVIGNATNWQQVSAGYQHSAGIKTDGTLWTWGLNNYGQLGDNTVGNEAIPVPSEIGDPFLNYNTLVLTGDGTNNGTNNTFLDSSGNNLPLTRNGNLTQGTFTPFSMPDGYWSNYFDGSGDYLTLASNAAFGFGTGNFTVEFWIYPLTTLVNKTIYHGTTTSSFIINTSASGQVVVREYAVQDLFTTSSALTLNTWNHVAVARSGTTLSVWLNGSRTSGATGTNSTNFATTALYIGDADSGSRVISGYLSNLRVIKGTDIYGANNSTISIPAGPLQAIANTVLLTCQSNRFIDKSLNNFAITLTGDVSVSTTSPFLNYTTYSQSTHGGSGYFDGSTDYITIPSNATTALTSNNFTLEVWLYFTNSSANALQTIYSNYSTWGAGSFYFGKHTSASGAMTVWFQNFSNSTHFLAESSLPPGNQWVHYALVRNGSTFTLYRNGISSTSGTFTGSVTPSSNPVYVGAPGDIVGSYNFPGFMSDFRIVNGTALYTANFTPPTVPLQRITNTALLLSFTNGQIVDSIRKNDLETVGDSKVSTAAVKYGSGSMYFDGNGDYLTSRLTDTYAFSTGDFTIEMWINPSTTNHQSACLISQEHIAAQNSPISISIFLNNGSSFEGVGNQLAFGQYNGTLGSTWTIQEFNIATISVGVWTHIALVRSGTRFTMFVNGVASRIATSSVSCSIGNTQYLIARRWDTYGSYPYFNGYIDDLRITKGVARYTGNFTPPRSLLLPVAGSSLLTCQNRRFVDNSFTASAITTAGDISVQPWSPFAQTYLYDATTYGGSGFFDGTGDYLTLSPGAAFQFGTGDFTVECWAYRTTAVAASYYYIDARNNSQTSLWCLLYENGVNRLCFFNGTAYAVTSSAIPPDNCWNHVAYTRSGTTGRLFLNGIQVGTATDSYNYNIAPTTSHIGIRYSLTDIFQGYFSGMRVLKGTALYTSNFTPPTGPLTAITNTQLLLNYTNAAIVDSTGKNDIETVANAQISTAVKKFGSGSMLFNGNGDFLRIASSPQFFFGTGDYTIEMWIYPTSIRNGENVMYTTDVTGGACFGYTQSQIYISARATGYDLQVNYVVPTNTWTHIAASRQNSTARIFVNGTLVGSGTITRSSPQGIVGIGDVPTFTGLGVIGYIDDVRVSKFARYTSSFTAPTAAFGLDQYLSLTSLLIAADGTNGAQNNTFLDSSTNNFTITRNGNVTQGSFTPFSLPEGNWSNYFDGSGDTLTVAGSSTLDLTEDFTIEFWTFVLGDNSYLCNGTQSGSGCWRLYLNGSNGQAVFDMAIGSWAGLNLTSSTGMFSKNVWTHFAVTRSGSSFRLFINGVSAAFALNSGSLINTGRVTQIGYYSESTGTYYSNWYLSNLRILKGRALYTANFTPTQNFTGTGSTTWRNVSCGKYFTAATKTDGSVWTWGYNSNGQLGDYSVIHRSSAVQVLSTGNTWQQVATGYHTAGVKTDGTMWVWGKNTLGQLGDNTIVHKSYPSQMTTGDPYYNRNVLLINANGTNNGQNNTFIDSSSNNFTITRNGNATQGSFTPNSVPEGYWSNFFSAANSYLSCGTSSNLALGSGDFTVEFWLFNYSYNPNYQVLMDWRTNGAIPVAVPHIAMDPNGYFYFAIGNPGGASFSFITSNVVLPLNVWNHLAFARSGSNISIYLNGNLVATGVNSTTLLIETLAINDSQPSYDYLTTGYFSNVRIVKGFAVYTQNFTPSTVPLTAIPGTVLLTCQGNRFRDISSIGNTITPNNTPSVTPFSPFVIPTEYIATLNGGSAYFDGSGDYLTAPASQTNLYLDGVDSTVEGWFYLNAAPSSVGASTPFFQQGNGAWSGGTELNWFVFADETYIYAGGGGATTYISASSSKVPVKQWFHLAVVYSSGTSASLYINGTSVATGSINPIGNNSSYTTSVGGTYRSGGGSGTLNYLNGYVSNIRIVKGSKIYTSNFTPSPIPPSLLPNTSLLLNFTNGQIFDAVGMNNLETIGDAKVSTSVVKYGSGSIAFDGTGDYLFMSSTPNFGFATGDFTIEAWCYIANTTGVKVLFDSRITSNSNGLAVYTNGTSINAASGSSLLITGGSLSANTWFHVALVRNGTGTNGTTLYLNGTAIGSATLTTSFNATSCYIGNSYLNEYWNGYVDDLRISRYARYTSNFTPGPITTLAVPATNWKYVSCGYNFTAATKTDGTLWTWGGNTLGQLGDTTTTHRSSPVQTISSNNTWRQASCGLNHMSALKTDGTLWSWGGNSYGNLADNTTTHRSSPVQTIIQGITWKQISAGDRGTAAILDANY